MLITESWLHAGLSDDCIALPDYTLYRCDRSARVGGGVCVYISNSLGCIRDVTSDPPPGIESVSMRIPSLNLFVVCAYVPPSLKSNEADRISEYFVDTLDAHLSCFPDSNLMIAGDFNTFDSSIFADNFSLQNCVLLPTRKRAVLDQIWVNSDLGNAYTEARIGPPLGTSDHNTIIMTGKESTLASSIVVKVWDFRSSNLEQFCHRLSLSDFSGIFSTDNVNDMCDIFYEKLQFAAMTIPFSFVTLSSNDKPWITPLLKCLINRRWNTYRNRQWELFEHYKKKVKDEIRKAKLIWTQRHVNSSKNVWKVVNEARGTKSKSSYTSLIEAHGGIDNFLSAVSNELRNNFNQKEDVYQMVADGSSWHFQASVLDVLKALKNVKVSKAIGSDNVPNRILKAGADWLAAPLHYIFVKSVEFRVFPDCWKLADVILVPKCKNPGISDFRPISLTPVISKIFEALVLRSVSYELQLLLGPNQYAFRKHGSTESALVKAHDAITCYLDDTKVMAVRMVCLDLTKAFDKLPYSVLLNRLSTQSVNPGFVLWLRSYLEKRTQRVKLCGCFGPTLEVPSGVPQGSILGPILFAAVMGVVNVSPDATLVMYADDVTIIEPIITNSVCVFSDNVKSFEEWIIACRMVINYSKSKQIIFKRRKNCVAILPDIEHCDTVKVLGVYWDTSLSWKAHFDNLLRVCAQRLYIIRVLKPFLSADLLCQVYNSIVVSVFLYAAPLFVTLPQNISQKLEKFNRRAHRLICGSDCNCIRFPSLSSQRVTRARHFFVKCDSIAAHPLHSLVPQRMYYSGHFQVPHVRSSRRLKSFFPFMSMLLNSDF